MVQPQSVGTWNDSANCARGTPHELTITEGQWQRKEIATLIHDLGSWSRHGWCQGKLHLRGHCKCKLRSTDRRKTRQRTVIEPGGTQIAKGTGLTWTGAELCRRKHLNTTKRESRFPKTSKTDIAIGRGVRRKIARRWPLVLRLDYRSGRWTRRA